MLAERTLRTSPGIPALLALAAAALPAGPAADQDGGQWLVRAQADDGRFPALWRPADPDAGPVAAPASEHDLRTTAFATLALLGDGSTMRSGPHRAAVKRAVAWISGRRDEHGRLGFGGRPDWILDHAVATAALCEAASLSEYALMHDRIAGPIEVLVDHLRRFDAGVDVELLVWCRIAARAAAAFEDWWNQRPAATSSFDSEAAALDFEVARLAAAGARAAGPRGEAARALLAALDPRPVPAAEVRAVVEPLLAADWPALDEGSSVAAADPLALLYGVAALWQFGPPGWKDVERRLDALVVRTGSREPGLVGSWDPRGALGETCGRAGATAVHALILEFYYRYCRLELAR